MTKQRVLAKGTESGEADEVMRKLRKSVVDSIMTGDYPVRAAKWFHTEEGAMAMGGEEQC